nr:MAG TPA: hypothetical protein [Caudoviricetes sp.]
MTIDEAIKKETTRAEEWRNKVIQFGKIENKAIYMELAEECEQKAKWLEELKCYKDKRCITINLDANSDEVKRLIADARIKAIDDFYSAMQTDYSMKGLQIKRRKILKKAAGVKEQLKKKYLKGANL